MFLEFGFLITGDFYLPELDWSREESPIFKRRSRRAVHFLDSINYYGLKQSVFCPPRGEVFLDLALTCSSETVSTVQSGLLDSIIAKSYPS